VADLQARLARIERATAPQGRSPATDFAHELLNADIERARARLTPQEFDTILTQVRHEQLRRTGMYGF